MISPEKLRFFSFFQGFNDSELRSIAMIAEEENIASGTLICIEGAPAEALYFLETGSVELLYSVNEAEQESIDGIPVGEINPGEPFSISAVIAPFILTSPARASMQCRVIKINSNQLQRLLEADSHLAFCMLHHVARVAIERLSMARVVLAAAWA